MPIITVLTRWLQSSKAAILILSLLAGILAVSSVPGLAFLVKNLGTQGNGVRTTDRGASKFTP